MELGKWVYRKNIASAIQIPFQLAKVEEGKREISQIRWFILQTEFREEKERPELTGLETKSTSFSILLFVKILTLGGQRKKGMLYTQE